MDLVASRTKSLLQARTHLNSLQVSSVTSGASLVAQRLKRLLAMWETRVQSLGREDPLEKEMATHSSILAWKVLMNRRAWQATAQGVTESDMTEVTES